MCLEEGGGRDGQRRRSPQTSSYVIDGVRLGRNRKRPGSAWRYSGTAVAAAVFDDRQDTTTAAADIVRYTYTSHAVHVYIYIYMYKYMHTHTVYNTGTSSVNLLSRPSGNKKKNPECRELDHPQPSPV